jgi:hypothetical protein
MRYADDSFRSALLHRLLPPREREPHTTALDMGFASDTQYKPIPALCPLAGGQFCQAIFIHLEVHVDEESVPVPGSSGPIRPLPYGNEKYGHRTRRVLRSQNRRARQARAPNCRFCERKEKHHMGVPVPVVVI